MQIVIELPGTVNNLQCSFKIVFNPNTMVVNIKQSRIKCDKPSKTLQINGFKIRSEDGLEFTLSMIIWKNGAGKLKKATLEQLTTTPRSDKALLKFY